MKYVIFILGLCLVFQPLNLMASKRALIIGIDTYSNGVPKLNGPEFDAQNMRDFLLQYGKYKKGNIKLLVNNDATRNNILNQFDILFDISNKDDDILIYYSGHGSQMEDLDNDEDDRLDETIVPVDTVLKNKKYINMISDDEVREKISSIEAAEILFIIDSCHSGTMTRSMGFESNDLVSAGKTIYPELNISITLEESYQYRRKESTFVNTGSDANISVWTAVSSAQLAFTDTESKKGSLFTNRFIKGLTEKKADYNRDGIILNYELLEYLREESDGFCRRNNNICVLGLTPTYESTSKNLVNPVSFFTTPSSVDNQSDILSNYINAVSGHKSKEDIEVRIIPNDKIKLGQKIKFEIFTPISGYLLVLDINSNGELTQLYPNKYSTRKWDKPFVENSSIEIPEDDYGFDFIASKPIGNGQVISVIVEDKINFSKIIRGNMALGSVVNGEHYLAELAYALRQTNTADTFNRRMRWSVQTINYEIVN